MSRTSKYFLFLVLVILSTLLVKGAGVSVPTGTWAAFSNMAEPRDGASAALLADGRVLITGGSGANGESASAEIFDGGGAFSPAASMNAARSRHVSVALLDGRVLVAGGSTGGGGVTNSAEIYDPASDSWTSVAGGMVEARAGHTASLLADGRALIAGGDSGATISSSVEIFDPTIDSFSFAGILSSPRKDHAAAVLADGRVLIVGGSDGTNVLASSDIFDATSGTVSAGPALSSPRAGHSATTLLDGSVLVGGGSNGADDLATSEIADSAAAAFAPGANMSAPRSGHLAFRLPNNNSVLIVGGSSMGTAQASAELYIPWSGTFQPTGALSTARAGAAGSTMQQDGLLLVAGGSGQASSELYGFATVKTDKDDYAPGEIGTISGSGWQPGETVSLLLHEVNNPDPHADRTFTATANAFGNIFDNSFSPELHDIGIRFYLTATGSVSQAQTSFTDAPKVGSVAVGAQSGTLTYGTAGSATYTITVNRGTGGGSSGAFTATLSVTTALPTGATALFSPNPVSFAPANSSKTSTLTISTTGSTPAGTTAFTVKASTSASDFATGDGTLTVGKATVTPSITANNKVYNGTTAATILTRTLTGVLPADVANVSLSGGTATFSDANVVNGKTVTATGLSLSGSAAGNYQLSSTSATTTANITAKNLTISGAVANNKEYDGGTSATVNFAGASLVGVIGLDAVSIDSSGYSASFATKTVANGKAVTVLGVALSGADAGNYTVSQPSGLTANITAKSVDPHITADNKVYDGTTAATIATRTLTGVIAPDVVSLTGGTATFADANVGNGKTVTATGLSLSGADAGNYVRSSTTATTTADITPKALTITADSKIMILNGAFPAFTPTYNGFVLEESPLNLVGTLTCTTTATGTAVGSYPTINCSGQSSTNYSITYLPGTLSVQYVSGPAACVVNGVSGPSRQILQPINYTGDSVFPRKQGSTAPAKFRVCDANGNSIGPSSSVVTDFMIVKTVNATVTTENETAVNSTTPDAAFRWDSTAQQWIFNISTKNLFASHTYYFRIWLNDGTSIYFQFGLK